MSGCSVWVLDPAAQFQHPIVPVVGDVALAGAGRPALGIAAISPGRRRDCSSGGGPTGGLECAVGIGGADGLTGGSECTVGLDRTSGIGAGAGAAGTGDAVSFF